MQKTRSNLTGLAVARHKYPKAPLLDGACVGLRLVALPPKPDRKDHRSRIYCYRTKEGILGKGKWRSSAPILADLE
jgi:hypothetical protein